MTLTSRATRAAEQRVAVGRVRARREERALRGVGGQPRAELLRGGSLAIEGKTHRVDPKFAR
jgi:hypothetical protein